MKCIFVKFINTIYGFTYAFPTIVTFRVSWRWPLEVRFCFTTAAKWTVCGSYYTLLIWQDNCYLERNDPHVHIETGLASWTFAAADENTPWLSSKKFTQSFDSSIFLDYISVAFIARSIRWTSSNFGSYPLSSNFLLNPDDLHLSMTWSQSFSVRLLPKLQFSAWCVNLITNWSTLSLFSCFIWQKMCLSYWMFAFGEKCSSNTFEAASHSYIPSLASIL